MDFIIDFNIRREVRVLIPIYTGCIKKLNRFEIALNFVKQLLVSRFLLHAIYGMQLSYSSKFRVVVSGE